jgi:hypothetical protein
MRTFLPHFRGPVVAVVAVIFTATIVLAAQPSGTRSTGMTTAASQAAHSADESAEPSDWPEPSDSAEPSDSPEPSDSADTGAPSSSASPCTVDLTQDPSVLAGLNHGSVVCTAAQQPTPSGYANHGAWVSHWARMNHGHGAGAGKPQ